MERAGVCGALFRSALTRPDPQLHRAPRVQVQALRELQAIAEGDSVYSSAQRQQQLSDELHPELPALVALVQFLVTTLLSYKITNCMLSRIV